MKSDSNIIAKKSSEKQKMINTEDKPFTMNKKVQWYTFEDCKIAADKIHEDHNFEEPMRYYLPTFIYSFKYNSSHNRPTGSLNWTFKEMYDHYLGKIYSMANMIEGRQDITTEDGMDQYNRLENMLTEKERMDFLEKMYNETQPRKRNTSF